jgi:hypothetical protein
MTGFSHHLSTDIFPNTQAPMHPLPGEIAGKGAGFRHQIKSAMLGRGTQIGHGMRALRGGSVAARLRRKGRRYEPISHVCFGNQTVAPC